MDSTQIHTAMREQLPVIYDGKRYDRIIEYISWYDANKKRRLSAVLLLGRSSYRVPAEKVEPAEK